MAAYKFYFTLLLLERKNFMPFSAIVISLSLSLWPDLSDEKILKRGATHAFIITTTYEERRVKK